MESIYLIRIRIRTKEHKIIVRKIEMWKTQIVAINAKLLGFSNKEEEESLIFVIRRFTVIF